MIVKPALTATVLAFAAAVQAINDNVCVRFIDNDQWRVDGDWRHSIFLLNYPHQHGPMSDPINEHNAAIINRGLDTGIRPPQNFRRPAIALGNDERWRSKFSEWTQADHRDPFSNNRTSAKTYYLTPTMDATWFRGSANEEGGLPWSKSLSYVPITDDRGFDVAEVVFFAFRHSRKGMTAGEVGEAVRREEGVDLMYGGNILSEGLGQPPRGYAKLFTAPDNTIHFWNSEWQNAPITPKTAFRWSVEDTPPPANIPRYHPGIFLCEDPNLRPGDVDEGTTNHYLKLGDTAFYNYIQQNNGGAENCKHGYLRLCDPAAEELDRPDEIFGGSDEDSGSESGEGSDETAVGTPETHASEGELEGRTLGDTRDQTIPDQPITYDDRMRGLVAWINWMVQRGENENSAQRQGRFRITPNRPPQAEEGLYSDQKVQEIMFLKPPSWEEPLQEQGDTLPDGHNFGYGEWNEEGNAMDNDNARTIKSEDNEEERDGEGEGDERNFWFENEKGAEEEEESDGEEEEEDEEVLVKGPPRGEDEDDEDDLNYDDIGMQGKKRPKENDENHYNLGGRGGLKDENSGQ